MVAPTKAQMGRYAFFSTGFEYKFRFGIQHSSDMLTFAGFDCGDADPQTGLYIHTWDQRDTKTIDESLKRLETDLGVDPLDIGSFALTLQGTYEMRTKLEDLYSEELPEQTVAQYILGCCIFHQLLYAKTLRVDFEA